MLTDYLIVGSGVTAATIARLLSDEGHDVMVVDRRGHLGGNVHDHWHPSGIRIHTYGPHYFRTNSDVIWQFVNRFARFHPYEASVKTLVGGKYENWPIAADYIQRTIGANWQPAFRGTPNNFEEASLAVMPAAIYEIFVKGYSEKQWGVPAQRLAATLARRFDVREDNDSRLMKHKHQGIPENGYAEFMRSLLDEIPVLLNCDYLQNRDRITARKMLVFTGPIDEFFGFRFGRLRYRGQQRIHEYLPDVGFAQPCGQVNNPSADNGPHIRTLEWKHMMPTEIAHRIRGTVLTREIPHTPADPEQYEYPFPDSENMALYRRYRELADGVPNVLICGRLGEYTYYDMDQAIGRAMMLARKILQVESRERILVMPTKNGSTKGPSDRVTSYWPKIDPVADGPRPLWSVMIPAHNGAGYLARTIRSVLAQDPGPEMMQIEVVDDHSLKEDLRRVVEQVGNGRVSYYRNEENLGVTDTFNICVQRSRGRWVHILHGDDMVLPGFYERLQPATEHPSVGAAFCRFCVVNEDDRRLWVGDPVSTRAGVLQRWVERIAVANRIQAPSIIVARHVYEQIGGYDSRMFHAADWDMWKRIACHYKVWYEPETLGCYRLHSHSDTSKLLREGKNIEDTRRSIQIALAYLPKGDADRLTHQAYAECASYALEAAQRMLYRRDFAGAWAQLCEALLSSRSPRLTARIIWMPPREVTAFIGRSAKRLGRRALTLARVKSR